MKKILKWLGITLGAAILVLAGTAFYLRNAMQNRLAKRYDVTPLAVQIPTDSAALAEGKIWASVMCTDCHGQDLAGTVMIDDPSLGIVSTPNISAGGVGKTYTDLDWDRAIRHGIAKDRRPLLIMPSKYFGQMSDEHIGQLIAYLKTVPAATKELPATKTTLLCDVLAQLGAFGDDMISAEKMDHSSPSHTAPAKAVSLEYGQYLVKITGCRTCHGEQLNGAKHPDPAVTIPASNLTPGGALASWGAEGFIKTLRTGVTPTGKEMDTKVMPWKQVGSYDDTQLKAIYAYLMVQPKMEMAKIK